MLMNYMKRPFSEWIKGPLLSTPQGWVVLLSSMVYGVLAAGFWGFGLAVPISASRESTGVFCACWPFIVFLFFVRDALPASTRLGLAPIYSRLLRPLPWHLRYTVGPLESAPMPEVVIATA